MRLKLLKPYGMLARGAEMDARASVGALLIQRGVAIEIKTAEPKSALAGMASKLKPKKGAGSQQ